MFDLDDTIRLTASNVDAAGNPVDSGAGPTVTITLPDGSTVSPAPVHDGTGNWHVDLVTTQSGRHEARWVGTGANAFAYTEAFTIDPTDVGMLFSLEEARVVIRRSKNSASADDDEIRDFIAGVAPVIEDLVGPVIKKTFDEWHDGGGPTVKLFFPPVLTVATVLESYGAGYTRTLSEQPLDGATFDSFGYTIDKDTGLITRRVTGRDSAFAQGRRNVHVVYDAGRTVIKKNIIRAAKEQFRFMWDTTREANRPGYVDSPDVEVDYTPSGFAVPRFVSELCRPDLRMHGIM